MVGERAVGGVARDTGLKACATSGDAAGCCCVFACRFKSRYVSISLRLCSTYDMFACFCGFMLFS